MGAGEGGSLTVSDRGVVRECQGAGELVRGHGERGIPAGHRNRLTVAVSIALGTLMVTLASGCASSGPHGPTGQARAATTAMASPSATAVALPAASPAPGAATPAPAGPREFPVGAGTSTSLQGVTCVGANDCWAVGWSTSETTGYPQAMIAEDTGIGWEVVSSPAPSGSVSSQLDGVACAGSGDCWAVGSYWQGAQAATGISLPLIEQDTGSGWKVVPGPSPAVGEASSLNGVTCLGAGGCWAVGYSSGAGSPGAASQTLIEQNTGSGWNIVSSPDPSSTGDGGQLAGVSCVSAAGCWAVGYWDAVNGVPRTLIEQYAGGGWSIVSSPGPSPSPNQSGGAGSILLGVTCAGGSGWPGGRVQQRIQGHDRGPRRGVRRERLEHRPQQHSRGAAPQRGMRRRRQLLGGRRIHRGQRRHPGRGEHGPRVEHRVHPQRLRHHGPAAERRRLRKHRRVLGRRWTLSTDRQRPDGPRSAVGVDHLTGRPLQPPPRSGSEIRLTRAAARHYASSTMQFAHASKQLAGSKALAGAKAAGTK